MKMGNWAWYDFICFPLAPPGSQCPEASPDTQRFPGPVMLIKHCASRLVVTVAIRTSVFLATNLLCVGGYWNSESSAPHFFQRPHLFWRLREWAAISRLKNTLYVRWYVIGYSLYWPPSAAFLLTQWRRKSAKTKQRQVKKEGKQQK